MANHGETAFPWIAILPLLGPVAGVLGGLLWTAWKRQPLGVLILTAGGLFLGMCGLGYVAVEGEIQRGGTGTVLLELDGLGWFVQAMVLLSSISAMVMGWNDRKRWEEEPEEWLLLLSLGTLGAMVLAVASHVITFFLGLEILSVSLYGLIGYCKETRRGLEAGLKYLLFAGAMSAVLLFGAGLIYAATGTLVYEEWGNGLGEEMDMVTLLGSVMVLTGVGFKLGLIPFHHWSPEIYDGASLSSAAVLATASKAAVVAGGFHFAAALPEEVKSDLSGLIALLAMLSMFGGNLLALKEENLPRLLAYSSIAHMGYLMVMFLAEETLGGLAGGFYLAVYTLSILGIFSALHLLQDKGREITALRGLIQESPVCGSALIICVMSLAGIPLTGGFIAKFQLVGAGAGVGAWGLVVSLMLSSVIGFFYYLKVVRAIIDTREPEPAAFERPAFSYNLHLLMVGTAVLILFLGVMPSPLLHWFGELLQRGVFTN